MARSSKAPRLPASARAKKNRPKKGHGNPAGHRQQVAEAAPAKVRKAPRDPRLGSTKPIPLIGIDQPAELLLSVAEAKRQLLQLEDDARFNALLDKADADAELTASEQAEFDAFVRRHQALLTAAGETLDEA